MTYISFDLYFPHGFCNKLFKWEVIYRIAEKNKMGVLLNWSELDYIDLPNTIQGNILLKPEKLSLFDSVELEKVDFILDRTKNHIANCGPSYTNFFHKINDVKENRPISKIKFKLNDIISEISNNNYVGIHYRADNFIFTEELKLDGKGGFYRTPTSWFINNCLKILERKPETKFYLATNAIETEKEDFFDNIPNLIDYTEFDRFWFSDTKMMDLCVLCHCKFVLGSRTSTFSMFPYAYNNTPVVFAPEEDIDNLIKLL